MSDSSTATIAAQLTLRLASIRHYNHRARERDPKLVSVPASDAQKILSDLIDVSLKEQCPDLPSLLANTNRKHVGRLKFGQGYPPERDFIQVTTWPFQQEIPEPYILNAEAVWQGVKPLFTHLERLTLPFEGRPEQLCLYIGMQPVVLPGLTRHAILDKESFKASMHKNGFVVAEQWAKAMTTVEELQAMLRGLSGRGGSHTTDWVIEETQDGDVKPLSKLPERKPNLRVVPDEQQPQQKPAEIVQLDRFRKK